ncbi:hypothetical protein ACAW63_14270 [Pseudomonas sp. QE6]|uniref:hypothetical protein n=1 Tax=Pseudomonas sp. QE6 TaxID=3242491 RepID=UPI0035282B17
MAWPVIACAQEVVYTDAEAASKAQSLVKEAYALHAKVAEICDDASAMGLLYEAAEDAVKKLDGWPDQKSQTLTSYNSCRQSMVDVQSYAYTCAQGEYKGKAVTYMQRRWTEDTASCDEAIRASALSGSGRN